MRFGLLPATPVGVFHAAMVDELVGVGPPILPSPSPCPEDTLSAPAPAARLSLDAPVDTPPVWVLSLIFTGELLPPPSSLSLLLLSPPCSVDRMC